MTRKELALYAIDILGHTNVHLFRVPRGGYVVVCDCGYKSTTRSSEEQARLTAVYHLSSSADKYLRKSRAAGVSPS